MTGPAGELPRFALPPDLARETLPRHLASLVSAVLPGDLPRQRWFGDKLREIAAIELTDAVVLDLPDLAALAVVDVRFARGGESRYLVPLVLTASRGDGVYCALGGPEGDVFLTDGLRHPGVRRALLDAILSGRSLAASSGASFVGDASGASLACDPALPSRLLGVEQSNSSLVFGDQLLLKVFRRLQPGPNPDAELVRFLSGKAAFANVPRFGGALEYRVAGQEPTVLAVAQEFVRGTGDGWSHVLGELRARVADGDEYRLLVEGEALGRRLGELTARMHLALASDPWSPDLAPEPVREGDIARWAADYEAMLDTMMAGLRSFTPPPGDDRTAELVSATLAFAAGLHKRTAGFRALAGRVKTRVHGDYHLGQTLHRADGEFVVLDFEGEPVRPVAERRLKTSPLKDVAGMLRSFGYARGTVAAELDPAGPLAASALVAWERAVRTAFVDAYASVAHAGGGRFLPDSDADFEAALAAWELDKATYEVVYELNNRPNWLWIPLSAMIKYGEPDR